MIPDPMRKRRAPIEDLRLAIDCLPRRTREAMLEGIDRNDRIIVGAYSDRDGGVCPMLAAHRAGGRTSFLSFARSWDRFTKARRPRPATERELAVLRSHLEASLLADDRIVLSGAVAEHQALARTRRAREAKRLGWGWTRRSREATEPGYDRTRSERELSTV
jgi:hypothetical protein